MSTPRTATRHLNGHDFFVREWGADDLPKLLMLHGFLNLVARGKTLPSG